MNVPDSAAPLRSKRWRYLPAVLAVIALLMLTIALAGPAPESRIPRNRRWCTASNLQQLNDVYTGLQNQIGYETARHDASAGWLRLGVLTLMIGAVAAVLINRRLPI